MAPVLPRRLNKCMELKNNQIITQKKKNGGARPGAGRPAGTKNKISGQAILDEIQAHLGVPFAQQLVSNYVDTINSNDTNLRYQYDKLILGKVVADKAEIELTESDAMVENKRQAFAEAIARLAEASKNAEKPETK